MVEVLAVAAGVLVACEIVSLMALQARLSASGRRSDRARRARNVGF